MFGIACVILCGGRSVRMGEDKALLDFGGVSLAQYMYEKCEGIFESVYLSCKDSCKFEAFNPLVLCEKESEFAPIFGIANALENLKSERVFVVSVDLPFLNIEHCKRLCEAVRDYQIVYAKTKSHSHYLCGIYHRSILPILREQIAKMDYKISNFISQTHSLGVMFENEEEFINLNTPKEYQSALERLEYGK